MSEFTGTAQSSQIPFVTGRGIKPGVTLDAVRTIDLAPTAARLLGVELQNVEGRALTEILLSASEQRR